MGTGRRGHRHIMSMRGDSGAGTSLHNILTEDGLALLTEAGDELITESGLAIVPFALYAPRISGPVTIGGSVRIRPGASYGGSAVPIVTYTLYRDGVADGVQVARTKVQAEAYLYVAADIGPTVEWRQSDVYGLGTITQSSNLLQYALPGLDLNLDGGTNVTLSGSEVTTWTSQGSVAHAFAQGTAINRPTTRVVNGRTGIDFDGSNDFLLGPTLTAMGITSALGLVIVQMPDTKPGGGTGAGLFGTSGTQRLSLRQRAALADFIHFDSSGITNIASTLAAPANGAITRLRARYNGTNQNAVKQGAEAEQLGSPVSTGPSATNYTTAIDIGRDPGQTVFFDGVIFAVYARRTEFTAAELADLDGYIAYRWTGAVV